VRRLALAILVLGVSPIASQAQDDPAKLAARCTQLYAYADQVLTMRSEGGGGPGLAVRGAGVDCQKGRYAQGIAELEKALRNRGYTPPPPQ